MFPLLACPAAMPSVSNSARMQARCRFLARSGARPDDAPERIRGLRASSFWPASASATAAPANRDTDMKLLLAENLPISLSLAHGCFNFVRASDVSFLPLALPSGTHLGPY